MSGRQSHGGPMPACDRERFSRCAPPRGPSTAGQDGARREPIFPLHEPSGQRRHEVFRHVIRLA
jgi:hypothetical protein